MHAPILATLLALNSAGLLSAATLANYDFTLTNQAWSQTGNWTWNSGSGRWQAGPETTATVGTLTSPVMTLNQAGVVNVELTHAYDFETFYDGGRFEFTADGGATWNVIAKNLFTTNAYNSTVELNDWGQMIDGAVFSDMSSGLLTSSFTLGTGGEANRYESGGVQTTFGAGTEVQFRLLASWGDDAAPSGPNWQISAATFDLAAVPEPSLASLAALAAGMSLWRRRRAH